MVPTAKPTPLEVRRKTLLASFSGTAVKIGEMIEYKYGVQLDDHRHKDLIADIEGVLAEGAAPEITEASGGAD